LKFYSCFPLLGVNIKKGCPSLLAKTELRGKLVVAHDEHPHEIIYPLK